MSLLAGGIVAAMTIVETERLVVREMRLEDVPFVRELFNERGFIRFVGDRGIRSEDDARRYIAEGPIASYAELGFGLWAADLKESGVTIGICGLLRRPPLEDVEIGFGFLERFCSRGYAFESAAAVMTHGRDVLGLKRIVAVTAPDNHGSINVLEKLGLRYQSMIELPGFEIPRKLFS